MNEIEIIKTARLLVDEFGQGAWQEAEDRAMLALLRDDLVDYELWDQVVAMIPGIENRKASRRP